MTKMLIKRKLKQVLLGMMLLASGTAGAQDVGFSQFYANPLYLNPAFAGTVVAPRISLTYRGQWPGLVSAFTTVSASYDQYVNDLHGGVGVIVMTDRVGDHGALTTNMVGAMYAFNFRISRTVNISAGLQVSLMNTNLRWDENLRFPDQINPEYGFTYQTGAQAPDKTSKYGVDFNAGALVYSDKWYAGFAASHLTQPNVAFYSEAPLPMKFTVHAGGLINVAEEQRRQSSLGLGTPIISPNVVYQYQGNMHYFNYGVYLDWMPFLVGVWFRNGIENADAFIFQVGVQQEYFKVGYSYDVTVSKLANSTAGAHEVTLGVTLPVPEHKKKVRSIKCPAF